MIVLMKKEDDKCQFVTFGRIKAIKTSQLKDGRASAEVTFLHFQDEEERTDKVLFVNSKNGKSFLADEIKKVPIGSEVLIAISKWNDAFFATYFATKEGCVRFGDEYVFFGTAHRLPESIGVSTVYAGKTKLHEIENMKMDEPKKELIILAKKNDKIRLSKRGEEIIMYDGEKIFIPVSPEMKKDVMITIGCYQNHPISSSLLLNKLTHETGDALKKLTAWVSYVVDDWEPAIEDMNCWQQKAVISEIYTEYQRISAMKQQ